MNGYIVAPDQDSEGEVEQLWSTSSMPDGKVDAGCCLGLIDNINLAPSKLPSIRLPFPRVSPALRITCRFTPLRYHLDMRSMKLSHRGDDMRELLRARGMDQLMDRLVEEMLSPITATTEPVRPSHLLAHGKMISARLAQLLAQSSVQLQNVLYNLVNDKCDP
jgi:hypothetical protein